MAGNIGPNTSFFPAASLPVDTKKQNTQAKICSVDTYKSTQAQMVVYRTKIAEYLASNPSYEKHKAFDFEKVIAYSRQQLKCLEKNWQEKTLTPDMCQTLKTNMQNILAYVDRYHAYFCQYGYLPPEKKRAQANPPGLPILTIQDSSAGIPKIRTRQITLADCIRYITKTNKKLRATKRIKPANSSILRMLAKLVDILIEIMKGLTDKQPSKQSSPTYVQLAPRSR